MKARNGLSLVELLIGIVVIAGLIWWYVARQGEKKEHSRIALQEQRERDERLAKQEAEKKAQEDARIAKEEAVRKRLAQEQKVAEEARIRALENKRLEESAQKTIEDAVEYERMPVEQAFWTARYRVLRTKFEDAELGFISEAQNVEKPKGVTKRTNFWYVNLDYSTERKIYEIEANPSGKVLVHALTEDGLPKELESNAFMKDMYSGKGVLMSGRKAWICGSSRDKRSVALQKLINGFSPAEADLKEFQKLMSDMKLTLAQNIKYRVTLKRTDGKSSTKVAIVSVADSVDSADIMKALKANLTKIKKERAAASPTKGPKLKRFRQTVVMYDGTHIKKDTRGITYVPRVFQHLGTAENGTKRMRTVEDFRSQWNDLRAEAERQERMAQEVARENQEAKDKFEAEKSRSQNALVISDGEARAEIDNYLVFIERGRGK